MVNSINGEFLLRIWRSPGLTGRHRCKWLDCSAGYNQPLTCHRPTSEWLIPSRYPKGKKRERKIARQTHQKRTNTFKQKRRRMNLGTFVKFLTNFTSTPKNTIWSMTIDHYGRLNIIIWTKTYGRMSVWQGEAIPWEPTLSPSLKPNLISVARKRGKISFKRIIYIGPPS